MQETKEIGGYFGAEKLAHKNNGLHSNCIKVNSGRNALEYIVRAEGVKKILVPHYTCDVVINKLRALSVNVEFYVIDEDFNPRLNTIEGDVYLLYTNYFGLTGDKVEALKSLTSNIILDNAMAYFDKHDDSVLTFYSPRKFFGVPDGGLACGCQNNLTLSEDDSSNRMNHLIIRQEQGAEAGYEYYQKNEKQISSLELKQMSAQTQNILEQIDYDQAKTTRVENFAQLHASLASINRLAVFLNGLSHNYTPLIYPLWVTDGVHLRKILIENKIYVPQYWANVIQTKDVLSSSFEFDFSQNLVPLPIDHRYTEKDMDKIIATINNSISF